MLDSFSYDPNASDYDWEVQRVKDADPDAIVLIGFSESARMLATLIEQGIGPHDKNMYGADGNMSPLIAQLVNLRNPSVIEGMKGTTPFENAEFNNRLRELSLQDFTYAAQAYDAVIVTALAAAQAGTDAPDAVAEHINGVTRDGVKCTSYAECVELVQEGEDIDYDGVSGPLEFTDAGEPADADYTIKQFQSDGSVISLNE